MAGPPGFGDLINRKYDIQQTSADASAELARAQARTLEASSPFENALRQAQTYQTNQQGSTLRPLADASIAATHAGIGETQARTGLFGAEGAQIYDGLAPVGQLGASALYRGMQNFSGNGYAPAPASAPIGTPINVRSVTDPTPTVTAGGIGPAEAADAYQRRRGVGMLGYAEGTPRVPLPNPAPAPAGPAPGQTITNGTWGSPTPNQDLRAKMFGKPAMGYAKGSAKVKGGGGKARPKSAMPSMMPPPQMSMPQGSMPGYPSPAMGPMPGGPGGPPGGLPGLAGLLQAAMGATAVPGAPPPAGTPQDRVPAMLTPNEAVLTPGAADRLGRGKIATLNAQHPPKPSGPGRGMVGKGGTRPAPKSPPPRGHTVNIHMKMGH